MIPGNQWNTKYFLLTQDDVMAEGDEFYNPVFDSWVQIDSPEGEGAYLDPMIGYQWDGEEHKPVRRKNPDYNPKLNYWGKEFLV